MKEQFENQEFYKPRVVFPFVEAGMGHIAPATSLADAFEKKYGAYTEVVRSSFFNEQENPRLLAFENMLRKNVQAGNKSSTFGFFQLSFMYALGCHLTSFFVMYCVRGAVKHGLRHMKEVKPDMIVSTHYSTTYLAKRAGVSKINALYVPDAEIIPLCRYPSDLVMISSENGYEYNLSRFPRRFNKDNLALVPFAIRKEAFACEGDKMAAREKLGLAKDRFTVVLFDGGYGLGNAGKVAELLAKSDLPLTVICICGRNEKLYNRLQKISPSPTVDFRPYGFSNQVLELLSAADLFMGKGGASSLAEACFFGLPMIVTSTANQMEKHNAAQYTERVGSALKICNPKMAFQKVRELCCDVAQYENLAEKARAARPLFGSEETADLLFLRLCEKYPHLKQFIKE